MKLKLSKKGKSMGNEIVYTENNLKEMFEFCKHKIEGQRLFNYGSICGDLQLRLKRGTTYISYGDKLIKDEFGNIKVIRKPD